MTPLLYCFWISATCFCASSSRCAFCVRNLHVLDGDGDSRASRELEAHILHAIGEDNRRLVAAFAIHEVDQVAEFLLLHGAVDFRKRNLGRHDLIQQDAADGRLDPLERGAPLPSASTCLAAFFDLVEALPLDFSAARPFRAPYRRCREFRRPAPPHPHVDLRVQIDFAVVISDPHFVGVGEELALARAPADARASCSKVPAPCPGSAR